MKMNSSSPEPTLMPKPAVEPEPHTEPVTACHCQVPASTARPPSLPPPLWPPPLCPPPDWPPPAPPPCSEPPPSPPPPSGFVTGGGGHAVNSSTSTARFMRLSLRRDRG